MIKVESTPTRLSQVISDKMEELGVTIKQLSGKADIVYEHTRRIVRGECIPSKPVLKAMCEALGLPYKEVLDMAKADKIQAEYGNELPLALVGKDPTLEPLERIWIYLTTEQQTGIISMAQGWAKHNKATLERCETDA